MQRVAFSIFSIFIILFIGGCGGAVQELADKGASQPHKKLRTAAVDWTWNVGTEAAVEEGSFHFTARMYDGMPDSVTHTQLFFDIREGGYNGENGWEVYGADYLIEDNRLFRSLSESEWKWEYLGDVSYRIVGEGDKKRIEIAEMRYLAGATEKEQINVCMEVYDADWNGAYSTVPLENITLSAETSGELTPLSEADMRAYVKAQLGPTVKTVEEHSVYSPYYQMAAVQMWHHYGTFIVRFYDFSKTHTPEAVEINTRQYGVLDIKKRIEIVGDKGDERLIFRLARNVDRPVDMIVAYDPFRKETTGITVVSGGAKETLKEELGNLFVAYDAAPNGLYAIVTERAGEESSEKVYKLYSVKNYSQLKLVHRLFTEYDGRPIRWLRILDNERAEFTVLGEDGVSHKVVYDYMQNREL